MTYSTIYDTDGSVIVDRVQSQKVCDETIRTARSIARTRGHPVVVEDSGVEECYIVRPSGRIADAPEKWVPLWQS